MYSNTGQYATPESAAFVVTINQKQEVFVFDMLELHRVFGEVISHAVFLSASPENVSICHTKNDYHSPVIILNATTEWENFSPPLHNDKEWKISLHWFYFLGLRHMHLHMNVPPQTAFDLCSYLTLFSDRKWHNNSWCYRWSIVIPAAFLQLPSL